MENNLKSIISVLNALASQQYTGHAAIKLVNTFIEDNKEHQDLIYKIIDRNLKCGISADSINKIYPNLIPEFKCALANKLDASTEKKVNLYNYLISVKLDGLRLLTFISKDFCKFYSRSGKEFLTLDNLKKNLLPYFSNRSERYVIDGELCILENGKEVFNSILKEAGKKDHTIKNPFYKIFDILTENEFFENVVSPKLSDRIYRGKQILETGKSNYFDILEQIPFTDQSFKELKERSKQEGWEGLILRNNVPYKSGRSNDLLKYKLFQDAEYTVVDVTISDKLMLQDGKMVKCNTIGALIIEHKGNRVQVGSGLSDEQRLLWYNNPSLIIGKQITVKYFEESTAENGEYSLRFPVLKAVYEKERDI